MCVCLCVCMHANGVLVLTRESYRKYSNVCFPYYRYVLAEYRPAKRDHRNCFQWHQRGATLPVPVPLGLGNRVSGT